MDSNRPILRLACGLGLYLWAMGNAAVWAQGDVDPRTSSQQQTVATNSEGSFNAVESSVQQKLEASLAELAALREAIADEKVPLSRQLSALEDQLLDVRRTYQQTTRELDNRTLDLTNLHREIQTRQEEKTFISSQFDQYISRFETRLHIAELQRYSEALEAARLASENETLTEIRVYETQAALVTTALERLHEALGGTRFEGTAVDPSGMVKHGTFVLVGPVALFRSDDGQVIGTAEQHLGSLEPTVVAFEAEAMTQAADELVATGQGTLPLDPTLGNAHKIEATKQSLAEHISKGGVVMYPILGLFAAAMLVVVFKWIELSRLRQPSGKRIRALLEAVAHRNKQAAVTEAAAIGGPTGAMLSVGVEHLEEPPALIEEVMYEKILTARLKLQRFLPFVAISAAAAPLLGLLGTVTGIINTFKLITVFGSGDVKTLSGGISEALITTEFGLIVAIPSLLLHAFLSRKARGMIAQMEKAAIALTNQISKTPFRDRDTSKALTEMPVAVADEVLRRLSFQSDTGNAGHDQVSYAVDSVASVMEPAAIRIDQNATVAETLAAIRAAGVDEDIHVVFVVDEHGRYVGDLHVRLLLTRPEQTRVESLVDRDTVFVRVDADREEVRHLIRTHNLNAVPVLDHDDQLVGRVIRNGE